MEIGVAAAGVAAAGLKLLGYNRSNFFQNLKLKQSRKFRRQQIITAQAELFRSDVQQVIGSSVTVQERLSVVSALMLVAATHAYGLSMPPETADFLEGLFYLNLSNSTLYFLLALFSSISASILARTSQKVLLNNCVRPPFEEMMAAVDEGEEEESAERFERQDASTLFRIPGSEALLRRFGSELLHRRQRFAEAAGQNSLQRLLLRQQNNDEALQRLQYLWDDLAAYTPYYLGWGLRNLLNAYAFEAMGLYYSAMYNYVFVVHFFWMLVALALSILTEAMMPTSCLQSLLENLLLVLGLGASLLNVRQSMLKAKTWWREEGLNHEICISIVAVFICQLGLSVCAHVRFYRNTQGSSVLQTLGDMGGSSNLDFSDDSDSESLGSSTPKPRSLLQDHIQKQSRLRDRVRTTCLLANITMIFVWLGATLGEVVFAARALQAKPPRPSRQLQQTPQPGANATVVLAVSARGRQRVLRFPGGSTVEAILKSEGLSLWERAAGFHWVATSQSRRLGHAVPLQMLEPGTEKCPLSWSVGDKRGWPKKPAQAAKKAEDAQSVRSGRQWCPAHQAMLLTWIPCSGMSTRTAPRFLSNRQPAGQSRDAGCRWICHWQSCTTFSASSTRKAPSLVSFPWTSCTGTCIA
ncbi:unnamed protein product [Effrenium voratum]|nr:unnamed protein product [Effrenium voratum]